MTMSEEKEQIYELRAEILVLGYSPEDAKERAEKMVFINDLLDGPYLTDWSHLDEPYRQQTIDRITREIKDLGKERW